MILKSGGVNIKEIKEISKNAKICSEMSRAITYEFSFLMKILTPKLLL